MRFRGKKKQTKPTFLYVTVARGGGICVCVVSLTFHRFSLSFLSIDAFAVIWFIFHVTGSNTTTVHNFLEDRKPVIQIPRICSPYNNLVYGISRSSCLVLKSNAVVIYRNILISSKVTKAYPRSFFYWVCRGCPKENVGGSQDRERELIHHGRQLV